MSATTVLSVEEAYRNRGLPASTWEDIRDEFAGDVFPGTEPSFRLKAGDSVFTVGSCFARNIEDNLAAIGCRVPMLDFKLPTEEFHGRANGALNRFTPPMFLQTFQWAADIQDRGGVVTWADCQPMAFETETDRYLDTDMVATTSVSRERFIERRQHIYDIISQAFTSDAFMMTPGYVESWLDKETGLYVYGAPTAKKQLRSRTRYELRILDYDTTLNYLKATLELIKARNPGVKMLITTSPVPLGTTFSGQDIRIANMYSKSVLRAACGAIRATMPDVDYFPSYESVVMTTPEPVWQADRLHVRAGFVGKIVSRLVARYFDGLEEGAVAYQAAREAFLSDDLDAAMTLARKVLISEPSHPDAALIIGEIMLRRRQFIEAEDFLERFVAAHPDRADLIIKYAMAIAHSGGKARRDETSALILKASLLPKFGIPELNRGARYLISIQHPEREAVAQRIIDHYPIHGTAYEPMVELLVAEERRAEALTLLTRMSGLRRFSDKHKALLAELQDALAPAAQ